ncbi:aminotransferase class III-fold pyridoxal phosphate-dependent enzyme [Streptomyces sp. SKN60]|uniref:aminotransferase class III-fold pyridoxal phosphate-dependent enzyme n=1 Tax=Streptomyces sp. SKN60 TaxID=2855506 RepID=UPI0022456495|nr:aminotransferase class III-fold pyridoxal phosphate-dependent enzyme [Streptomyces sp. SKN60]MCX2181999.1 aminotransferase class III-fold pyridoxal phosphate-dependent enzyme [Streptomyces sp. SKN60]
MSSLRLATGAGVEAGRLLWWTSCFMLRWVLDRALHPGRPDARRRLAALLRSYLLRMGPLYMKAGQILGTQSGILSAAAAGEFRAFFSDLPPMPDAALRKAIDRGLPVPVAAAFESFDWQPVAVGCVAQVHRAVLDCGTDVAVKVVKSGVRQRLEAGTRALNVLLVVAHALCPPVRRYDLPGHFAELRPLLAGQCDMRQEAARQKEVAWNFRDHPFLHIPSIFDELCTGDVLVMEYVDGVPGMNPSQVGHSRSSLARRLQDVFYSMVFFHGRFHVDPHPGNILFRPDGRIVLLDFGLVGTLSADDKWSLSAFYYACIRGQWEAATERFVRTFVANPDVLLPRHEEYAEALAAILRHHFQAETSRWSTMAFFDDATRLLYGYGARASTRFSLLSLSLLTGEGFVTQTDPDIDLYRNARRFTDLFSPYMSDDVRERFEREIGGLSPRSLAARHDAAGYLVAPTHLDRYGLPSAFPLVVAKASGARIHDLDGNEYIDLSCGYGPHILGYGHHGTVQAVQEAVARGAVNALGNPAELRLAELIAQAFGTGTKVILGNSGTEAVQMALRMARAYTGRQRVAKFEGHYHGFSDQSLVSSLFRYSGDARCPNPVANSAGMQRTLVQDTLVLQYGDPASLDRIAAHAKTLACVILEPMPVTTAAFDRSFLRQLRDVCARENVLVIYDEVITGFRVHYGGAQRLAGVRPDLTCLGKIIGGGLPCGAVAGRPDVIDIARTTGDPYVDIETRAFVGGTMSGNSVTAAAGAAVLAHLSTHPGIYGDLQRKTEWLAQNLTAHAADIGIPCKVTAAHSIFSITFDHATPQLIRDRLTGSNFKANLALSYYMRKQGVYVPELHTMMLSAAHTMDDLQQVSRAFARSIEEMNDDGFFTT